MSVSSLRNQILKSIQISFKILPNLNISRNSRKVVSSLGSCFKKYFCLNKALKESLKTDYQ